MRHVPLMPSAVTPGLRILAGFLPAKHRELFLGDLIEEYEQFILPSRSALGARTWLWQHAFRAAGHGIRQRIVNGVQWVGRIMGMGGPPAGRKDSGRSQMDILITDLRYAFRRLSRSPGFTAVAVISLALGIGANSAIFSIVNALLLRGAPVEDVSSLVEVYTQDSNGYPYATSSYPDYADLRDGNEVFSDVMGYNLFIAQSEREGEIGLTMGELVSGNYFDGLGVHPALGRTFLPEEDVTQGTHPVVVLGHAFWERAYGSDPGAIGKTVYLLQAPYTIVGVAPDGFNGMMPGIVPDMYVPMAMSDQVMRGFGQSRLERRGSRNLFLKARLLPGVTPEQADEFLGAFSTALGSEFPDTNEGRTMSAIPSQDVSIHPLVDKALVPAATLLLVVVGLVLLIACANLASFLLARGADRRKEIAVRLAMGAKRRVLVRQLLTETMLLSVIGGVGGIALANWTIALLMSFQPPIPIPINLDLSLDRTVLVFTIAVSVAAGLIFGLVPALQSTNPDVAPTLRDEAGATTGSRRRWSLRNGLVVGQVALSFVLLIGAGLFVRSLQKAQTIDPGFDTSAAAIVWPNLEMSLVQEDEGRILQQEMVARVSSIPGVTGVALVSRMPLGAGIQTTGALPEGVEAPEGRETLDIDDTNVDAAYFELMSVPILRGRNFNTGDVPESEPVAIVSEAFVRAYWPGETGLGKTIENGGRTFRVVGVARDTKVRTLGEAPRPFFYRNAMQLYSPAVYFVVRGTSPAPQLVVQTRASIKEVLDDVVFLQAQTMQEHLSLMLYLPRMAALLLAVFGGLALSLSGIGLYGLVSYSVARRTREVGVRMSLGADRVQVVRMVVGGGMKLVAAGGVIGIGLAAMVTWLLARFLYGIGSMDVATFVLIPVLLVGVALVAAYIPARRASLVNPVDALRSE